MKHTMFSLQYPNQCIHRCTNIKIKNILMTFTINCTPFRDTHLCTFDPSETATMWLCKCLLCTPYQYSNICDSQSNKHKDCGDLEYNLMCGAEELTFLRKLLSPLSGYFTLKMEPTDSSETAAPLSSKLVTS
jgi:hypothetical protein